MFNDKSTTHPTCLYLFNGIALFYIINSLWRYRLNSLLTLTWSLVHSFTTTLAASGKSSQVSQSVSRSLRVNTVHECHQVPYHLRRQFLQTAEPEPVCETGYWARWIVIIWRVYLCSLIGHNQEIMANGARLCRGATERGVWIQCGYSNSK